MTHTSSPSFRVLLPWAIASGAAFLVACGSSSHASSDGGNSGDGTVGSSNGTNSEDGSGGSSGAGASGGGASNGGTSNGGASGGGASSGGASSGASSGTSSGASSSGASGGSSSSASSSSSGGGTSTASVYQHHKNGTRDGAYVDPVLTSGTSGHAATIHAASFKGTIPTSYMGTTSAVVFAQPLYVENGPGGAETFIVANELNQITAFNATTGAVIWEQGPATYAAPVTAGLPCGNVSPLGILGTPIIDPASPINGGQGVIYFDAMTNTGASGAAAHKVYAVKLSDGTVLPNWPVDVSAKITNFVSAVQNQRGALQFVNGVLYVPYGGLDGDCYSLSQQPYYGWVVAIPAANPQSPYSWHTAAPRGGIWAPGSLPTDGSSIFPVTGNTSVPTPNTWGGGEAVIRLVPGSGSLTFSNNSADYYAPYNWQSLDNSDSDLGGANDVLFDMPGTSKPHLVAAGGKDGNLYILNRDSLGGIGPTSGPGTELFKLHIATGEIMGAPAAYTTTMATYLAFHVEGATGVGCSQRGNLVVVKVTASASANPTASVAWCSSDSGLGSPIVTTTDGKTDPIVWDANNALWAYDGDTGAKLFTGNSTAMSSAMQAWNTPIAIGNGRLAVAVNGQLYVFTAP